MTAADLFALLDVSRVKRARVVEWQGTGVVLIKCDKRKHHAARALIEHRKPVSVVVVFDPEGLPWWRGWLKPFVMLSVPHGA